MLTFLQGHISESEVHNWDFSKGYFRKKKLSLTQSFVVGTAEGSLNIGSLQLTQQEMHGCMYKTTHNSIPVSCKVALLSGLEENRCFCLMQ